jgi:hypothetical protein
MRAAIHSTAVAFLNREAEDTLERATGALPTGAVDRLLLLNDASADATFDIAPAGHRHRGRQ